MSIMVWIGAGLGIWMMLLLVGNEGQRERDRRQAEQASRSPENEFGETGSDEANQPAIEVPATHLPEAKFVGAPSRPAAAPQAPRPRAKAA